MERCNTAKAVILIVQVAEQEGKKCAVLFLAKVWA